MNPIAEPLSTTVTPTGERIRDYCRIRHAVGHMVVVIGPPGIGKTVALRQFASEAHPFVRDDEFDKREAKPVIVTMRAEIAKTVRMQLETILWAVADTAWSSSPNYHNRLRDECAAGAGPIIIDEAQFLSVQTLDSLRGLWDEFGTRFVFAGNDAFGDRFDRERKGPLAQFASRTGAPLRLTGIARGDVDAIGRANGVSDPAGLDVLAYIAERSDLRTMALALRIARAPDGAHPNVATLRDAGADALGDAIPRKIALTTLRSSAPADRVRLHSIEGGRA